MWMVEERERNGRKTKLGPKLCGIYARSLGRAGKNTRRSKKKAEGLVFHSAVSGTSGTVQEVKWGGKSDDALEQTNLIMNLTSKPFQHQVGKVHYHIEFIIFKVRMLPPG